MNVFDSATVATIISRIDKLTPSTTPQWGKMSVDQMLAHLNVAYEMVYDGTHPKPNGLVRFMLKAFVKKKVIGPDPYARNTPTAPAFRQTTAKDFGKEKARLLAYLRRVQGEGALAFEGRESLSFGPLTSDEWNMLFSKHLDHHLGQFGV
jgi:hypothetical protein